MKTIFLSILIILLSINNAFALDLHCPPACLEILSITVSVNSADSVVVCFTAQGEQTYRYVNHYGSETPYFKLIADSSKVDSCE